MLLSTQTMVQDAVTQLRATERGKYVTFIVDISCQGTPSILGEVEYLTVAFLCFWVLIVSTVTLCFKRLYHQLFQTENFSIFHPMYFYVACTLTKKWIISLNSTNGFVFVMEAKCFLWGRANLTTFPWMISIFPVVQIHICVYRWDHSMK